LWHTLQEKCLFHKDISQEQQSLTKLPGPKSSQTPHKWPFWKVCISRRQPLSKSLANILLITHEFTIFFFIFAAFFALFRGFFQPYPFLKSSTFLVSSKILCLLFHSRIFRLWVCFNFLSPKLVACVHWIRWIFRLWVCINFYPRN